MKKSILLAAVAMVSTAAILPASAEIDWIGNHIQTMQEANMRRHQQEMLKPRGKSQTRARKNQQRKSQQPKMVVRNPRVQVNGRLLQSSVPATQRGNHTFVPMRSIFEALGAAVTYDSQSRIITADRGGRGVQLRLRGGDSSKMKGKTTNFGAADSPFVRNGITMVPLRFVSEQMGARVAYMPHPTTPLISITSKTS